MLSKCLRYSVTSLGKVSLPHPYEYTLNPNEFQFKDARFDQFPAVQKLFPAQKDHIEYVFNLFERLINKNSLDKATADYIDSKLIRKIQLFRGALKDMQIQADFRIDHKHCTSSAGYLEYYGYQPSLFIHEYSVNRIEDKLMLVQKEELNKALSKTEEELLRQDMQEISKENSLGHKIKEKMFKKKLNTSKFVFDVAEAFQYSYNNSLKQKKFKNHVLVNRIDTKMNVQLTSPICSPQKQQFSDVLLTTKWHYQITSEEPESIRKSRKRILFDFQLWNRGCLIPVKDFSLH